MQEHLTEHSTQKQQRAQMISNAKWIKLMRVSMSFLFMFTESIVAHVHRINDHSFSQNQSSQIESPIQFGATPVSLPMITN